MGKGHSRRTKFSSHAIFDSSDDADLGSTAFIDWPLALSRKRPPHVVFRTWQTVAPFGDTAHARRIYHQPMPCTVGSGMTSARGSPLGHAVTSAADPDTEGSSDLYTHARYIHYKAGPCLDRVWGQSPIPPSCISASPLNITASGIGQSATGGRCTERRLPDRYPSKSLQIVQPAIAGAPAAPKHGPDRADIGPSQMPSQTPAKPIHVETH